MRNTLLFLTIFVFVSLLFPDGGEVEARRGGGRSSYSRSRSYRSDSSYRSYRSYRSYSSYRSYRSDYSGEVDEGSTGGGLTIGAIIGIVIVSIIVIAVATVVVFFYCR